MSDFDPADYPVEYVLLEIRNRNPRRAYATLGKIDQAEVERDSWQDFVVAGGKLPRGTFTQIVANVFFSLGSGPEGGHTQRVRCALAPADDSPGDKEVIVWKPQERVSGVLTQFEILIDLSDPANPGAPPLIRNTFYALRSDEVVPFGAAKDKALADFEAAAKPDGPYPGQAIYGAICTGVYRFERP